MDRKIGLMILGAGFTALWLVMSSFQMPSAVAGTGLIDRNVKLCNDFSAKVWVAFAYHLDKDWVSDGWYDVKPGECQNITLRIAENDLYLRGESDTYMGASGKVYTIWGGDDRKFCVPKGKGILHADSPSECRAKDFRGFFPFTPGMGSDGTWYRATIRFKAHGKVHEQIAQREPLDISMQG